MLPGLYPSDNHIYRTTVQFRLVEVMMMHTAVTVAANSLDAHVSPGRQSSEDIRGPSEAGLGLVSPIATDNIRGSLGCCLGPGASVWGSLGCCLGPGASVWGSLGCCLGPRASSRAALDAVQGLGHLGHLGPKASQPYWILEPLQKFHRQFLRIPAFSMQKQYSQRSTQC